MVVEETNSILYLRTDTTAGTGTGPDDSSLQWSYWDGSAWTGTNDVSVSLLGVGDECIVTTTTTTTATPINPVTISFTWGSSPDDMDLWVVSVKDSDNSNCTTNYASLTPGYSQCTEITLDIDQTMGGLIGPEIVTLKNPPVNKDYTYLIGVEDFKWTDSTKDEIINSGAKITIQNSDLTETVEAILPSSVPAPTVSK